MNQYDHNDMLADYTHRSPATMNGGYSGFPSSSALNRQPSRQFSSYDAYAADDEGAVRYDTRTERLPPNGYPGFGLDPPQWTQNATPYTANTIGAPARLRGSNRRANLPSSWMEASAQSQYSPMPASNLNGFPTGLSNGLSNAIHSNQSPQLGSSDKTPSETEEELIPTAIVIKNIPFAVKREQLADLMASMGLPAPYAFNYHFDNGVFRGLAFANFQNPQDTAQVINTMNHMELQGRKLRVEYKKMLPAVERDRIEREKRQRRGQLEEQHRPIQQTLHNQGSMNSLASGVPAQSPSPVSTRDSSTTAVSVNLNDRDTLNIYNELIVFKLDAKAQVKVFPPMSPIQRRIVHELAHMHTLQHASIGDGEDRYVQITKEKLNVSTSQASPLTEMYSNESNRRGLSRAATTDFSEQRANEAMLHSLRPQHSGLLNVPGSPNVQRSLREAKSFGDLQPRNPSPVGSNNSFPIGLASNISRFTNGDMTYMRSASGVTNFTPASTQNRDDYLASGFSGLSLGNNNYNSHNAGRLGGTGAGAIGSQRVSNSSNLTSLEDPQRSSTSEIPARQPRGPGSDWIPGFGTRSRPNGQGQRNSAEIDLNDSDHFNIEVNSSRFH